MKEVTYLIALGSNLPSAFEQLEQARHLMAERLGAPLRCSRAVATAPLGGVGTRPFANQVVACRVALTPSQVEATLKEIEREMGRNATASREGVIHIDLDLLAADGHILRPTDWERPYIQAALNELQ